MAEWVHRGLPSAGVYAGPVAWLASLQAKYAVVPWVCANKIQIIHPITLATLAISLGGAYLSWRAWSRAGPGVPPGSSQGGEPHRFLAAVGVLIALLFTAVILLQGAAAFVLHGCER